MAARECIAVAVGALVATVRAGRGLDAPKVVEAERFVVKGKGDKPRAVLEAVDGVSPRRTLLDEGGNRRLVAGLSADGKAASLDLKDGQGRPRLSVQLVDDVPKVALIGEDGMIRFFVHLGLGDTPGLAMMDGDGDMRFATSITEKNALVMSCPDKTKPLRSLFTLQ